MSNFEKSMVLPDVQSSQDQRHLFINRVGVKSIRYPVSIQMGAEEVQPSIGEFEMYVSLEADKKGTHMSRFFELLDIELDAVSVENLDGFMLKMLHKLEAQGGYISISAPFFIRKNAPVTGVSSLLDYQAKWEVTKESATSESRVIQTVIVPVKSLCPCSKNISQYGAHNQRSHITIQVEMRPRKKVSLQEQVRFAEESASCELWSLLKREDEKYVTEKAYENPKFVEDLVRDVALKLNQDDRIAAYQIESENFESIHNHSAYACIKSGKNSIDLQNMSQ